MSACPWAYHAFSTSGEYPAHFKAGNARSSREMRGVKKDWVKPDFGRFNMSAMSKSAVGFV